MPISRTLTRDQSDAFAAIGRVTSAWLAQLRPRDIAANAAIQPRIAEMERADIWDRDRPGINRLRGALVAPRSMTTLRTIIAGQGGRLGPVLAGSPGMDTGVVMMLIASYVDPDQPADIQAGRELLALVQRAAGLAPAQRRIDPLPVALAENALAWPRNVSKRP